MRLPVTAIPGVLLFLVASAQMSDSKGHKDSAVFTRM